MHDTEESGKILAQIICEQPPCVGFELGLSVATNKLVEMVRQHIIGSSESILRQNHK